jgi:hypothetical protein
MNPWKWDHYIVLKCQEQLSSKTALNPPSHPLPPKGREVRGLETLVDAAGIDSTTYSMSLPSPNNFCLVL